MGQIFKNQTKLRIRLTLGVSVLNASRTQIQYRKPSGPVGAWTAVVESISNGVIYYDLEEGDLDETGIWMFWGYVIFASGGNAKGEPILVTVYGADLATITTTTTSTTTTTTTIAVNEGIFYPAADTDDGYWDSGWLYSGTEILTMGGAGDSFHTFVRFRNVSIPQGASIQSAFVKFTCYPLEAPQESTPVNLKLYFNDIDTAISPTNVAEAEALILTSAYSDWVNVPSWQGGEKYNTPSLVSAIQEIIDRVGWVSGENVMLVVRDNESVNAYRRAAPYYEVSGIYKAELHLTWTE
jgi:hypothetical protein